MSGDVLAAMKTASPSARHDRIALGTLLLLLVLGVARAIWLAWTSDDAFVSFRYAENLVSGHGLVYNAGERVEGYTNLLWTLLLAAAMRLGAPVVPTAQVLGVLAYLALALCLARRSLTRQRSLGRPFLPLAAALVLVSNDFQVWATGGLETMLFTLLAVQGLLLTRAPAASLRAPGVAGLLFSLLVLTRPDGLLLAALGALSYLLPASPAPGRVRLARALCVGVPVGVTTAALVAFKLAYYGEILPTSFYSKSVLQPWYGQGLWYVGLYLAKNWFLPVAAVALLVLRLVLRRPALRETSGVDRDDLFLVAAAGLFIAYLVHVGGDFMFARRLIPVVPLLLVALEDQVVLLDGPRLRLSVAAACVVGAVATVPLYSDERARIHGIADEPRYYRSWVVDARRQQGQIVGRALRGIPARVMFEGGMCSFGYYSRLPYLVEMTGLTQYSLSRLPLVERGRVGHEKQPTDAWLRENRIHLVVSKLLPPFPRERGSPPFDQLDFGNGARARILLYSDEVMDRLRAVPGVRFMPIERAVGAARRKIGRVSVEEAERIYRRLDRYYFESAGERGVELERALRAAVDARRRNAR